MLTSILLVVIASVTTDTGGSSVILPDHDNTHTTFTAPSRHRSSITGTRPTGHLSENMSSKYYVKKSSHRRYPPTSNSSKNHAAIISQIQVSHQNKKSSSSLSRKFVEELLDLFEEHKLFTAEGRHSAILTPHIYQGKRRLVYKLTPGAIFGGVRTRHNAQEPNNKIHDENIGANSGIRNYFIANQGKHSNVYSGAYTSPHITTTRKTEYKRRSHIPSPSSVGWEANYQQLPPPPLSSMENPYLPAQGDANQNVRPGTRAGNNSGPKAGGTSESVVLLPAAHGLRAVRSKVRGAYVSFLLLHYLGFIPEIPGFPRHRDPTSHRDHSRHRDLTTQWSSANFRGPMAPTRRKPSKFKSLAKWKHYPRNREKPILYD